jgi:hypothetical protein
MDEVGESVDLVAPVARLPAQASGAKRLTRLPTDGISSEIVTIV